MSHPAAVSGNASLAPALQPAGAPVTASSQSVADVWRMTPGDLMEAAKSNDLALLRRYIGEGGALDQMYMNGMTALSAAIMHGNDACAIALLDAGANPVRADLFSGESALHVAVAQRRAEIVDTLLVRADVESFIDLPDMTGSAALHVAASLREPQLVGKLLDAGASCTILRPCGFGTAVHDLVLKGDVEGSWPTMKAFLEREEDPVTFLGAIVHGGQSLLHVAASVGGSALIGHMLDLGVPVDVEAGPGAAGGTPFHFACAAGQIECLRVLAARGADIHKISRSGDSALTWTLRSLYGAEAARTLAALIELGLDPEAPEHGGAPRKLARENPEALRVLDAHAARRAMARTLGAQTAVQP